MVFTLPSRATDTPSRRQDDQAKNDCVEIHRVWVILAELLLAQASGDTLTSDAAYRSTGREEVLVRHDLDPLVSCLPTDVQFSGVLCGVLEADAHVFLR